MPPDASFASSPYAERTFVDNTNYIRRCWCAVERKGRTAIHYYEQVKTGSSTKSASSTYALKNEASPIIKIENIGAHERRIVVAQDAGSITCLSSEGGSEHRCYQLGQGSATLKFHAIQSMSLASARASVLKGRPDICVTLPSDSIVISAVFSDTQPDTHTKELFFGVWVLFTTASSEHQSVTEPTTVYELQTSREAVPRLTHGGSKLELRTPALISTFDLTTATPQKLYDLGPFAGEQFSSIDLTSDISLACGSGELRLYNLKFNSLLAATRLGTAPLKRKRDGSGPARMSFISYFSQLRRVVASSGSQLLAIDIHIDNAAPLPFKQSSLLVGNVMKGQGTDVNTSDAAAMAKSATNLNLKALSQDLEDSIRRQDAPRFERCLREAFDVNGWEDLKRLDSQQRCFVISKMFDLPAAESQSSTGLGLKTLPAEFLKWCIKSGILDDRGVSKALCGNSDLPLGAVANALSQASEDLGLLHEYITQSPHIRPAVLTWIIKSLIDRVLTMAPESKNDCNTTADTIMGLDGNAGLLQPNHLHANSRASNPYATNCLLQALKRLATAGSGLVSEQLQSSLEQKEVLALIQFLRQQLFLGGYTRLAEVRSYPSPPPSHVDGEDTPPGVAPRITLDTIVTLLNGCVDSLGIVGVIASPEEQIFIERMIPELCSEIESATAAVEDSTYLQGLVRETLRYAESVERQPFQVRNKVERSNDARSKKGRVTILYSEADVTERGSRMATALPLSLKAEEDLSKRKTRKGGQVEHRSVREMGMLKDRLQAPYTFERLVL